MVFPIHFCELYCTLSSGLGQLSVQMELNKKTGTGLQPLRHNFHLSLSYWARISTARSLTI